MKSPKAHCPCESGKTYQECCQVYHDGEAALTAEALMRSRYTAYALGLEEYLLRNWHKNTRPESLDLHEEPKPQWLGLQIKSTQTINTDTATVEFVARYKVNGKAHRLHEISQFVQIDKHWFYLNGNLIQK